MDLSFVFGASNVGSDMNGATLFCVSGRAGLAFLSRRIRGVVDLVEAVIELAVDGREEWEGLADVLVMTGGGLGVFGDKSASDGSDGGRVKVGGERER